MLAAMPALSELGLEVQGPELVEAEHPAARGRMGVEIEDAVLLGLEVGVGRGLPGLVVEEADAVLMQDAPELAAADGRHDPARSRWVRSLVRLQEVKGAPRSAGRARATFTIAARCSASIRRGRPPPLRGSRAAKPCSLKAWMSSATWVALARCIRAICGTLWPWNEANRSIARCCVVGFLLRRASWRRWSASPSLSSRMNNSGRRATATSCAREAHGRASGSGITSRAL